MLAAVHVQARFKYPPHWVPLPMLYEAMGAIDPTTGQPRGYLRLSANVRPDSVLFTLDIRPDGSWRQAEAFIQTTAPQLVQVRVSNGGVITDITNTVTWGYGHMRVPWGYPSRLGAGTLLGYPGARRLKGMA